MKSMKHKRHSKRHSRKQNRATRKQRGGVAPVNYSLAGSWPSRMSLGQGTDYESYHVGQHGGAAPYPGSFAPMLPAPMVGPAMVSGIDRAIADVRGLVDPPFDKMQMAEPVKGGKRKHKGKKSRKAKKSRKTRRNNRKQRGGMAPVGAPTMLLSGVQYTQAGLNPDYRGAAPEYAVAAARDKA